MLTASSSSTPEPTVYKYTQIIAVVVVVVVVLLVVVYLLLYAYGIFSEQSITQCINIQTLTIVVAVVIICDGSIYQKY